LRTLRRGHDHVANGGGATWQWKPGDRHVRGKNSAGDLVYLRMEWIPSSSSSSSQGALGFELVVSTSGPRPATQVVRVGTTSVSVPGKQLDVSTAILQLISP
jgi:hypothetical protein